MKFALCLTALLFAAGCGGNTYTPPASTTSEPNWDAARDAGYSEADIEAAKTYDSEAFKNADPKVQEDMIIYNTLRQQGYSEDEALEATLNTVD